MSEVIKLYGVVDVHTHLRDLDWKHKATFLSETRAAVAGGYWAVFDMPNTPPTTIHWNALQQKMERMSAQAVCDWGVYVGASQCDNTAEYARMASHCCGLKIFNNSTTGDLLIDDPKERERHFAAWMSPRPIAVHAEEETILDVLRLVRMFRKPTHFLHISSAYEMRLLVQAKEEGLPVTLGVCPHHLYLTERDVSQRKGYAMMKPPLKKQTDVDALWEAIRLGAVDVIESDHAPHTRADKEAAQPAYGVPGLETNLPLLLTAVKERQLPLALVVDMFTANAQRIWNIHCPQDTYTLVDIHEAYTIDERSLFSACGWTPFHGMKVYGKVLETWIRGVKVYDGTSILVEPGFGKNLVEGNPIE